MSAPEDRELIVGLLAFRRGLISRDQLISAIESCKRDPSLPLPDQMLEAGWLSQSDLSSLSAWLDRSSADLNAGPDPTSAHPQTVLEETSDFQSPRSGHPSPPPETVLAPTEGGRFEPRPREAADFRFQKLRAHARGGLGEISIARDCELGRLVALKEILPEHLNRQDDRKRFVREAEIHGNLEHPGIVPVYGFGTYPDGRPYYAMRLIQGETLDEAIQSFHHDVSHPSDSHIAFRRLLSRFVDICNAIAYAHSRGVIHRDLKPANVLLGPFGETLIIDWGLAKVLKDGTAGPSTPREADEHGRDFPSGDLELPQGDPVLTQAGRAVGTPRYMSPEQASGRKDLTSLATDIYGLGAILYAILTGQAPIERSRSVEEILRSVQAGQIRPPRTVHHWIPRALEAICLQALATKPEDRYASAKDLAADVERFLADEPTSVYREPAPIRVARWARRNRSAVSAATAGLLMILVSLVVTLIQQSWSNAALRSANLEIQRQRDEVQRQRERAEANFLKARQAVDDAFRLVSEEELLDAPGLQPLRRRLLERSMSYYEDFLEDAADVPGLTLDLASAQVNIGEIVSEIGKPEDALHAYHESIMLLEQELEESPEERERMRLLAKAVNGAGVVLDAMGRAEEALEYYERARTLIDRLLAEQPEDPELQRELAGVLRNIGTIRVRSGQVDQGAQMFERSLETVEAILGEGADHELNLYSEALSLEVLGKARYIRGDVDEAIRLYKRALAVFDRLLDRQPNHTLFVYKRSFVATDLGALWGQLGEPERSLAVLEEAYRALDLLARSNPDVSSYRSDAAMAANGLSDALVKLGRDDEALEVAHRAKELLERLVAQYPNVSAHRFALSKSENVIARIHERRGQRDEALTHYLRCLEQLEAISNPTGFDLYNLACNRALCLPLLDAGATPIDRPKPSRAALADAAVTAFRRAAASRMIPPEHVQRDPDLDALRGRRDFQAIVRDLVFPEDPFAR